MSVDEGVLIRAVVPERGRPYEHSCSLGTFQEVCHAIDAAGARSFTGEELAAIVKRPSTQVFTALAFLKECGALTPRHGRRHSAASGDVFLDGMIEFAALETEGPSGA